MTGPLAYCSVTVPGPYCCRPAQTPGIISSKLHADGSHRDMLKAEGNIRDGEVHGDPFIKMEGQAVFKFAVKVLSEVVEELLEENHLKGSDVDWLVPHQANIRIMEATAKKLGLNMDKVIVTVASHGNTSAASIPLGIGYCSARWPNQAGAEYPVGGGGRRVYLGCSAHTLVICARLTDVRIR